MTWRRPAAAIAALVLVAVAVAVVARVTGGPAHDARVERVRDAIDWPDSCAAITTHDTRARSWGRAEVGVTIECEHLGPAVRYARFASEALLREQVLADTPAAPVCVAGREVLVDILDPGQFAPLCRGLRGDLVDGVSALPELPGGVTIDEINRYGDQRERRDAAAQQRALRRYWRVG